jgi:hypothetical protein
VTWQKTGCVGGIFRSVEDLIAAIHEYLARHNEDPKPFIWTKTAGDP